MSAPIILCDTAGMTNERWLECRAHGPKGTIPYTVGGSDVAAIFGVSPWTTPLELWMIKKGRMKAPVKPNQEQLMMGHLLEPIAAYWYQQKTGNTVYDDTYMYQHADHPWALADFDRRFTRKEDNAPGILECKSCTYHKAGDVVSEIKAVGYCLPTADNLRYDMRGRWSRSAKHGIQFEVEGFDEVIVPSKEGVISYLCSGQIKGIGPKTAEKIYAMFGQNTLTVLDHEPEQLLAVSGISKTKLKKICDSYLASRGARDVVAFLAPHGVTPNRAVKLYKQYGEQTMDIVRNHPYRLCEMVGVGFKTADRIAISMGFDPLSPERVDEGLIFTLTDAELKRHLCMEKHSFLKQCLKLLDTEGLTEEMLAVRASRMLESGRLASYDRQVYRAVTARTEQSLAWAVYRMLTYEKAESHVNIDTEISAEEKKQGIQLASEQRHAVTTALTSQLSVITGGPGTGKTLIQRFLLDIYRRKNRGAKIICCAPTGRAARRMEQSTGFPATTIHKALGLLAGEDGDYCEPEMLDADLIVVDEVSMMDIYLANHLFRSVPHGSQVSPGKDCFVATARIYPSYKDPVDCYLAEATASRGPDASKPSVSPREWAQTAAVGIALRNAGFGLQFSAAGDDFADMAPDELPAGEMDMHREPPAMEQPVQAEQAEIEPAYEPEVLTEEQRLEQAFQKPCPIKKYSGKTLGEVLAMDPNAIAWVANKYKDNQELSDAARLICEHAMQQASV